MAPLSRFVFVDAHMKSRPLSWLPTVYCGGNIATHNIIQNPGAEIRVLSNDLSVADGVLPFINLFEPVYGVLENLARVLLIQPHMIRFVPDYLFRFGGGVYQSVGGCQWY
jgi:hypothetical protein